MVFRNTVNYIIVKPIISIKNTTKAVGTTSKSFHFAYFTILFFCVCQLLFPHGLISITFFLKKSINVDTHNKCTLISHPSTFYLYDHIRKTRPTYLEIDEVTTDTSLFTGTLFIIKNN